MVRQGGATRRRGHIYSHHRERAVGNKGRRTRKVPAIRDAERHIRAAEYGVSSAISSATMHINAQLELEREERGDIEQPSRTRPSRGENGKNIPMRRGHEAIRQAGKEGLPHLEQGRRREIRRGETRGNVFPKDKDDASFASVHFTPIRSFYKLLQTKPESQGTRSQGERAKLSDITRTARPRQLQTRRKNLRRVSTSPGSISGAEGIEDRGHVESSNSKVDAHSGQKARGKQQGTLKLGRAGKLKNTRQKGINGDEGTRTQPPRGDGCDSGGGKNPCKEICEQPGHEDESLSNQEADSGYRTDRERTDKGKHAKQARDLEPGHIKQPRRYRSVLAKHLNNWPRVGIDLHPAIMSSLTPVHVFT